MKNYSVSDFTKNSLVKDIAYHGTFKNFDTFSISKRGSYGKGFYFFKNEYSAHAYGNIVKKCLLDIRNPFYLTSDSFKMWSEKYYSKNISDITTKLKADGYDGVITQNEYVVFDDTQIEILN
jgi:hypothetical protein